MKAIGGVRRHTGLLARWVCRYAEVRKHEMELNEHTLTLIGHGGNIYEEWNHGNSPTITNTVIGITSAFVVSLLCLTIFGLIFLRRRTNPSPDQDEVESLIRPSQSLQRRHTALQPSQPDPSP